MGASSVVLRVESGQSEGSYTFVCPVCEDTIEKRADRKVVMLLLSAGVEVREVGQLSLQTEVAPPEELFEEILEPSPESRPAGAAFTVDDLIDFHFLLEDDDWLHEHTSTGG